MASFTCNFDFSDVKSSFDSFDKSVKDTVADVGKEAVAFAIKNGNYHDVTGHLRASNRYEVASDSSLNLINDAEYATDVEAEGYDVLGNAALFAEKRLKEKFE